MGVPGQESANADSALTIFAISRLAEPDVTWLGHSAYSVPSQTLRFSAMSPEIGDKKFAPRPSSPYRLSIRFWRGGRVAPRRRWRIWRYYAIIVTADGHDLNGLLVSNGLARIYGSRTPLPDGRDSREYLAHLHELENEANAAKRGAWGKGQL